MQNDYTFSLWRYKKTRMFLSILCLSLLVVSCGEDAESEDVIIIDSAYLADIETTLPPVPYPIYVEDVYEMKVGESLGYEDINWDSIFNVDYSVSNPVIVEGEDSVCVISDDVFSIIGTNPGTCIAEYPSSNGGLEGSIFITISVSDG